MYTHIYINTYTHLHLHIYTYIHIYIDIDGCRRMYIRIAFLSLQGHVHMHTRAGPVVWVKTRRQTSPSTPHPCHQAKQNVFLPISSALPGASAILSQGRLSSEWGREREIEMGAKKGGGAVEVPRACIPPHLMCAHLMCAFLCTIDQLRSRYACWRLFWRTSLLVCMSYRMHMYGLLFYMCKSLLKPFSFDTILFW